MIIYRQFVGIALCENQRDIVRAVLKDLDERENKALFAKNIVRIFFLYQEFGLWEDNLGTISISAQ